MSKMNPNEKKENASKNETVNNEEATNLQEEQSNAADETAGSDNVSGEVEALQKKYNELNDSHLRLMAEFDNYRKRTMREKADLIKTGGEGALKNLLQFLTFIKCPVSYRLCSIWKYQFAQFHTSFKSTFRDLRTSGTGCKSY